LTGVVQLRTRTRVSIKKVEEYVAKISYHNSTTCMITLRALHLYLVLHTNS
jgi:hypothetical protein